MIHHIRAAFRYLNRNRIATTINVVGLTVALSAAFLMLQYLDFELSYDTYLPEHNNIYRIATETGSRSVSETYYGVSDLIRETFPEVRGSTRFYRLPANTGVLLEVNGKLYNEKSYLFADKGFFDVFPSLLTAGDAKTCIAEPKRVVVSERLAMKLFGTTDVLGKTIINPEYKDGVETITGVIINTPANSHFDVDVIRPYDWIPGDDYTWKSTVWTYVRLNDRANAREFEGKLNSALKTNLDEPAKVFLQPLASIHLRSNLESEVKTPGSMLYIYMVSAALVLIAIIAWINYVNLETARFIKRLKEVGIRRIIGSSKGSLFGRFFVEYLLVTSMAVMIAIAATWMLLPGFGYITGLPLTTFSFSVSWLWSAAAISFVVATIIAGMYPFLSLLKVNPISYLKGQIIIRGKFIRSSLLTFQFVASLTLMALVVTALFQLDFMRSSNKNFETGSIVTIYNPSNYTYREYGIRKETNEAFRNKLSQIPSVTALTTSSAIPGEPIGFTYTDLAKRSLADADRQVHYKVMYIDYDFIPLFNLELLAGRNYSPEYSDENCLVVTESTIRELGFASPEKALNEKIYFQEDKWEQWTIVGIVKDYRHESIKTPANPGIFRLHRNKGQMVYYSVKISDSDAIPSIEKAWKETWPGKPFEYFFMDQHYDQQYKSEIHFSRVFTLFSGVAVFIACLGIMGMTLFEANARVKEIGIRKVLGAEVISIVNLLMKGSLRLLLLSAVVTIPLVYMLAHGWLIQYPEHVNFSMWFIAAPFLVMTLLVVFTSISQTLKVAIKNPVDSLKQD